MISSICSFWSFCWFCSFCGGIFIISQIVSIISVIVKAEILIVFGQSPSHFKNGDLLVSKAVAQDGDLRSQVAVSDFEATDGRVHDLELLEDGVLEVRDDGVQRLNLRLDASVAAAAGAAAVVFDFPWGDVQSRSSRPKTWWWKSGQGC